MSVGPYDHLGMSDDQLRNEQRAQELVAQAKALLVQATKLTATMRGSIMDGLDSLPMPEDWDDAVSEARHPGYRYRHSSQNYGPGEF